MIDVICLSFAWLIYFFFVWLLFKERRGLFRSIDKLEKELAAYKQAYQSGREMIAATFGQGWKAGYKYAHKVLTK